MKDTEITYEQLKEQLKSAGFTNFEKIDEAYFYAKEEHKGKKRLTGDDYITHPLHVTEILASLNVDESTIISSLLHEVLNNGENATEIEIEKKFGKEVSLIVESISKINKLELVDNTESSAIYLRKVLVGLAEDPRVLYIKLADRLHNMRTNWVIKEENQKDKARETMNVLVPIAHRLGINSLKSELENICLKICEPEIYNDILEKLNKTTEDLNDFLQEMISDISNLLSENGIAHEIKGRVKSVYSIYNKLKSGRKWNDIYDILALRIFVEKESECYQVIGLIHSKYRPVPKRFKDFISNPKENMYQSLHTTVFGNDDSVYEVQVRTYEMDEIAEKGIASHWSYKEKGTKKVQIVMEQKLEMFRNIIETSSDLKDEIFMDTVNSNLLSELIYVYTPKGDVIELPKDSTPIDFAYRIHSGIGDKTTGAIVNDSIVPLSYNLQNNDLVKIITNSNATPNKDWLNFVKTTQAKSKIKSYFSKKDKEIYINKGKVILEKELKKRKIGFNEIFTEKCLQKIFKDLKIDNIDELYLSIGSLRYTVSYIINLTKNDKHNTADVLINKLKLNKNLINSNSDVLVDGKERILYSLAKCCYPIKGDEIVGYITKGEGVTIHKKDCQNISNVKERIINVSWNENISDMYLSEVEVESSLENFLLDLITIATKEKITISEIKTKELNNIKKYIILVKVKDIDELNSFKNSLDKLKETSII